LSCFLQNQAQGYNLFSGQMDKRPAIYVQQRTHGIEYGTD